MVTPLDRLSYSVQQRLRTGWFSSQYALTNRFKRKAAPARSPKRPESPFPSARAVAGDLKALFERDWANIEAGHYLAPEDGWPNPFAVLKQAGLYFEDLKRVNRRIDATASREIAETHENSAYPDYYLQNFHYQTDGYLSPHSAGLYDYQVEVLFTGGADAMRRQALVPLGRAARAAGVRRASMLDIACGTGRFLRSVKENFPRLHTVGIDLSPYYLTKARETLAPWSRTGVACGGGETLPFADNCFDMVSSIYLFHELPRAVRRQVAREMARVLKPGGTLIFVDSLQPGDHPPFDPLLTQFPLATHEPYYADYLSDDLEHLFAEAGLAAVSIDRAFFSRIMVLRAEP